MATLGIRQSAWNNATDFKRRVVRLIADRLGLGEPAKYKQPNGNTWFVFDDTRFSLTDAAYLATLLRRLSEITPQQEANLSTKTDAELRVIIRNQMDDVVLPGAIDYSEGDPWTVTFSANGAPASVNMASSVPAGWTPEEVV